MTNFLSPGADRSASNEWLRRISRLDESGRLQFIDRAYRGNGDKEPQDTFYRVAASIVSEMYLEPAATQGMLPPREAARQAFADYSYLWMRSRVESHATNISPRSRRDLSGVTKELMFNAMFAALRANDSPLVAVAASAEQDIFGDDEAADLIVHTADPDTRLIHREYPVQVTGNQSLDKFLSYNQHKLTILTPQLFFVDSKEETTCQNYLHRAANLYSETSEHTDEHLDHIMAAFQPLETRITQYLQERPDIAWTLNAIATHG
jgi:hypothetical protein